MIINQQLQNLVLWFCVSFPVLFLFIKLSDTTFKFFIGVVI